MQQKSKSTHYLKNNCEKANKPISSFHIPLPLFQIRACDKCLLLVGNFGNKINNHWELWWEYRIPRNPILAPLTLPSLLIGPSQKNLIKVWTFPKQIYYSFLLLGLLYRLPITYISHITKLRGKKNLLKNIWCMCP